MTGLCLRSLDRWISPKVQFSLSSVWARATLVVGSNCTEVTASRDHRGGGGHRGSPGAIWRISNSIKKN